MPKTSSEQTGDKTTEQEVLVKWQFRKLCEDKPRWNKFLKSKKKLKKLKKLEKVKKVRKR